MTYFYLNNFKVVRTRAVLCGHARSQLQADLPVEVELDLI
jgi:hypothetical protein